MVITLVTSLGEINFIPDYSNPKQCTTFQSIMIYLGYLFKNYFNFCSYYNTRAEQFFPDNKDPERYIIFIVLLFAVYILCLS